MLMDVPTSVFRFILVLEEGGEGEGEGGKVGQYVCSIRIMMKMVAPWVNGEESSKTVGVWN